MYNTRVEYYKALETEFEGPVIAYITGDRPGFETRIAQDVIDLFIAQLDKIGPVERIVLYLYTRGGDTSAAWNIVNLLKMYCDDLMVIIPHKAHSAGTIISLGANKIVKFKSFGYNSIRLAGKYTVNIAEADIELLESVWETYGDHTGNALEALSHSEPPWIEARVGYAPNERCNVPISVELMKKYYSSIYLGGDS